MYVIEIKKKKKKKITLKPVDQNSFKLDSFEII